MTTDTFSRRLEHLRRALDRQGASLDVFSSYIEALLDAGDRAGALQAYRRYAHAFEGADPQGRRRLRAIHERALWSAPGECVQSNLPTARNVIIGREGETHAIAQQLAQVPITCLTGPGGVGKTRIALEIARRVLPEYADGVWWIDLSPLDDATYFAEHVAKSLSMALFQREIGALAEGLSAKACLLVLDRCEAIPAAVREFAELVQQSCPNVRLLLTSRVPAGASGECEIRIVPLEAPPVTETGRAAALRSPAVQLFVERAASADARFALTDANADEVAALCRRMDGLPLAIELAASSVGHLPLEQIVQGVRSSDGDLRGTIAWSLELLDAPDRAVLQRLSVFVAPFGFDEAAAAAGSDVTHALKRLIEASLVQIRLEKGAPEYYLLDSTRDLCLDALRNSNGYLPACRNALVHYRTLATGQAVDRAKVERSFTNVAHVLGALSGDPAAIEDELALLAAMATRFGTVGHVDESAALCESALRRAPTAIRETAPYVDTLRALAWFDNRRGHFALAIARSSEAFAWAQERGDALRAVRAGSNAYVAAINSGDYAAARDFADRALEVSRANGDAGILANAIRSAAGARVAVGDFADALPLYEELLSLDLALVPADVLAMALHDHAVARLSLGNLAVARTLARRCLEVSTANGDYSTEADAYNVLGAIALGEGNLAAALRLYRDALALANRPGLHPVTCARTLEGCAASALRDDQLENAAQILGYSEQIRRRFRAPHNPFERAKAQALRTALASRLGDERFEAAILAGRTRSHREIAALVARLDAGSAPPEQAERFAELTPRERGIAELASAGASNREISEELHLSVRTVENHLAAIYRKLGIKSRAEL